jgi:oligopeptidase A
MLDSPFSNNGHILSNRLTHPTGLPAFASIRAEDIEPAVIAVLDEQRQHLKMLEQEVSPTLDWALELERISDAVHKVWGPVAHLNSVVSSPDLRAAYNRCIPLVTEFETQLSQNKELHNRFSIVQKSIDPTDHVAVQLVSHIMRDFRLAGVTLEEPARRRYAEIAQELAQAQAKFEQNLMDATDAFAYHETDKQEMAGLPQDLLERAEVAAKDGGHESGWRLLLDPPTYIAVMTHADSERLRERFYEAWVTRASDQGPSAGTWDNSALIEEILGLRVETAKLLGFENYAELSLATKMAGSTEEVLNFLRVLAAKSRAVAEDELRELTDFAGKVLKPWDIGYFAERLKRKRFQLAEEELRPYFPLPRVMDGLFRVVEKLFDLRIAERANFEGWHADVRYFEISSEDGKILGGLFVDLFARPNKRGGAWMDECLVRAKLENLTQLPVAYLVCNFTPPGREQPSLLTHNDVVTLFHEFGHTLHHLLTEIDYPSLSGINGVPWDAVELPSQFLENYAWLPEVLPLISGHYETGETLPENKLATLEKSRTFHAGMAMVRQLELALFDFRIHVEFDSATDAQVSKILDAVRSEVAVLEAPAFNRFACTFSHIFGGGYAAGYYSYKWAEVLAADAFSAFEEHGNFDRTTAEGFRRSILASGGSRNTMDAYTEFRGRAPTLDALLIQAGIETRGVAQQ